MPAEILDTKQLADRLQVSPEQVRKMTADRMIPHLVCGPRLIRYNLDAVLSALNVVQHPDDDAVDTFAEAMRNRMDEKRAQGRQGWEDCDPEELRLKLLRSIADGDVIDVANYCMMLHQHGADATHTLENHLAQILYEFRWPVVLIDANERAALDNTVLCARALVVAYNDEVADIKTPMEDLAKALGV